MCPVCRWVPPVNENGTLFWREALCNISHLQLVTVCLGFTAENTTYSTNRLFDQKDLILERFPFQLFKFHGTVL